MVRHRLAVKKVRRRPVAASLFVSTNWILVYTFTLLTGGLFKLGFRYSIQIAVLFRVKIRTALKCPALVRAAPPPHIASTKRSNGRRRRFWSRKILSQTQKKFRRMPAKFHRTLEKFLRTTERFHRTIEKCRRLRVVSTNQRRRS